MKNKKLITNKMKNNMILNIMVYILIFLFYLIRGLYANDALGVLKESFVNADTSIKISALIIVLIITLINSLPLMLIYFGLSYAIKKHKTKNSIFNIKTDLEYYREKLSELSPLEISLLMDMDVENQKDIRAMLLYYELHDIIRIDNNQIVIHDLNNSKLNEIDYKILRYFTKQTMPGEIYYLEKDVINSAIKKGLIVEKNNKEKKKYGNFFLSFIHIILVITLFLSAFYYIINFDSILKALENAPENENIIVQTEYILKNKELIKATAVGLLFSLSLVGQFWSLIAKAINKIMNKVAHKKYPYKRTDLGNELTEKIYGLKNFIKDFSNLKESTKKEIILWDEFLVYAIVLEENTKIVYEISELMHKNLDKYNNYN